MHVPNFISGILYVKTSILKKKKCTYQYVPVSRIIQPKIQNHCEISKRNRTIALTFFSLEKSLMSKLSIISMLYLEKNIKYSL